MRNLFCSHSCWCCAHFEAQAPAQSPRAQFGVQQFEVQGTHDDKCYRGKAECQANCKDHDDMLES